MNWEDNLRSTARNLRDHLERAHPNPPGRRRVRWTLVGIALVLGSIVYLARPGDPAAAIERTYAEQIRDVRIDDPELRREFEAALASVDRAIALAKDALRRSPQNAAFAELCHLALRAKVRLIQAYSQGG